MWKHSDVLSLVALIDRGLNQNFIMIRNNQRLIHYVFLSVLMKKRSILNNIGNDKVGGTPVPMPNTAVKPYDA